LANQKKNILIQMEIVVFKIPPCEDILVIGTKAPIGKNAMMKMLETITPDWFELVEVENPLIEAMVIKKEFIRLIGKDRLAQVIVEEVSPLMAETSLLHIRLDAKLINTRTIEVPDDSS